MHPEVTTLGLSILGGIAGYVVGLFGGTVLISIVSSNTHDKSMEVVMTGFFVTGPLMAVIGFVSTLIMPPRNIEMTIRGRVKQALVVVLAVSWRQLALLPTSPLPL